MYLDIITPQQTIFSGAVDQATMQTYVGEISILPEHMPLVTITKPGLMKILPTDTDQYTTDTFVFHDQHIFLSIGNGIAYTDGEHIKLVVEHGSIGQEQSTDELNAQLDKRQKILDKATQSNDEQAKENAQIAIETIKSHLALQSKI